MKVRIRDSNWLLGAVLAMAVSMAAAAEVYTPKVNRQSLLLATSPEGEEIFHIYRMKDGKWAINVPKDVKLENAADQFIKLLSLKLNQGETQTNQCPPCFKASCGNLTTICSYAPRAEREGE